MNKGNWKSIRRIRIRWVHGGLSLNRTFDRIAAAKPRADLRGYRRLILPAQWIPLVRQRKRARPLQTSLEDYHTPVGSV
jgi:hypothetical protein